MQESKDEREARIQSLVKGLGSEDYDERERSSEKLLAIGGDSVTALRTALTHSRDPEVQARVRVLLQVIKERTIRIITSGRAWTFDRHIELNVSHDLTTRWLVDYRLKFCPYANIPNKDAVRWVIMFEEIGRFGISLRPSLPPTSHLQFTLDGTPTKEFGVKYTGWSSGEHTVSRMFMIAVSEDLFQRLNRSEIVEGQLYSKATNGDRVERKGLGTFVLPLHVKKAMAQLSADVAEQRKVTRR